MTKEFDVDKLRKKWRDELVERLCKLVEPTEALQELIREHPDYLFLREDVIQVLRGKDGASPYISGDVGLELSRLFDLLKLSRDTNQNDRRNYLFLRPAQPNNHEYISAHGQSIKVIRLPKYMHQDNTHRFSVAIVLVHDISKPPDSFDVSIYANSFQSFGSIEEVSQEEIEKRKKDFWNSFTILYEREFGKDEITHVEEPFIPILDKLWKAIKDGENYFDFNEHINPQELF